MSNVIDGVQIELNGVDCRAQSKPITIRATGEKSQIHFQKAYLHFSGLPYPKELNINIPSPAEAYPPGFYHLPITCIDTNKYGELEINRRQISLVPVKDK